MQVCCCYYIEYIRGSLQDLTNDKKVFPDVRTYTFWNAVAVFSENTASDIFTFFLRFFKLALNSLSGSVLKGPVS